MKPLYKEIYEVQKREERGIYALSSVLAVLIIAPIEALKRVAKRILPSNAVNKLKKIGKRYDQKV